MFFQNPGGRPFALDRGSNIAFDTIREWEVERLFPPCAAQARAGHYAASIKNNPGHKAPHNRGKAPTTAKGKWV